MPEHAHTPQNPQDSAPQHSRYQRIIKILAKTCARIVLSVNRPAQDFIRAFNEGLIDILRQSQPKLTIAEMSLRTGIDRRQISQYLKQQKVPAWSKPNTVSMLLAEIHRTIQTHCPDGVLPVQGEAPSLEAICQQLVPGRLHAQAVLRELVRLGHIEEKNGNISLNNRYYFPEKGTLDFLNTTVWAMDQLGKTIEHNRLTSDPRLRNFQRSVYSTQIPPWKAERLHPRLKQRLESYYNEVAEMLKEAEDPCIPVGFYPPYGASFFELGRSEAFQPSDQQVMQEMQFRQGLTDTEDRRNSHPE